MHRHANSWTNQIQLGISIHRHTLRIHRHKTANIAQIISRHGQLGRQSSTALPPPKVTATRSEVDAAARGDGAVGAADDRPLGSPGHGSPDARHLGQAHPCTVQRGDGWTRGSPEGGRPLYVHAMSVGAYMFSLMLLVAQGEPGRYGAIIGRVRAQVFDSMVAGSLEHMAKGVSVTSMPSYLSGLTYRSTLAYFSLLRPYTVAYYEEALAAFKRGPCYAPALVYYSLDDRLSDAAMVDDTVDGWRGRGQEVSSVCWDKSRHAAHMRTHESEYLEALHSFMAARGVRPLAPAKL
ncbi:uncharacterized protein LOC144936552 isoform X3 [Lampetra fluviatilis]